MELYWKFYNVMVLPDEWGNQNVVTQFDWSVEAWSENHVATEQGTTMLGVPKTSFTQVEALTTEQFVDWLQSEMGPGFGMMLAQLELRLRSARVAASVHLNMEFSDV